MNAKIEDDENSENADEPQVNSENVGGGFHCSFLESILMGVGMMVVAGIVVTPLTYLTIILLPRDWNIGPGIFTAVTIFWLMIIFIIHQLWFSYTHH